MTSVAISLATAALPYVVSGVTSWVSKSAQTWGPAAVANNAIEGAASTGANLFVNPVLSKIGEVAGRTFGWASAPFIAQSVATQSAIGLGGQVAAGAAGALVHVIGGFALNKMSGSQQIEEPAIDQLIKQNQLLRSQIKLEALEKLHAQIHVEQTKAKHVLVNDDKLEKLAAKLNISVEELVKELNV